MSWSRLLVVALLSLTFACSNAAMASPQMDAAGREMTARADVVDVRFSGSGGSGSFAVTLHSGDTGCEAYADWWEVLRADGSLVTRRILGHSHVNEQPFTRSGSRVSVADDEELIVRAHFARAGSRESGYGGQVMRGTIAGGFQATSLPAGFAADLENAAPQPSGCAF